MSYILDALKKSEQKRKQEKVPDLLTIQEVVADEPHKRPVWPYLLLAGLLVNAFLIVWWMLPRREVMTTAPVQPAESRQAGQEVAFQPKADQQSGTMVQPRTEEMRMTEPVVQPQPAERLQHVVPSPKSPPAAPLPEKEAVRQPGKEETRPAVPVAVPDRPSQRIEERAPVAAPAHVPDPPQPLPIQPAVEPKAPEPAAAPPDNRVYAMKDLPPSVQKTLPPIVISVFLYSETPSSRMVRVNDRIMREGQEVSAGLKLEEVTPDGVIFRYQGYRFKMLML